MNKVYTGIGSRETPIDVLELMEAIAYHLSKKKWVVRTGGAPGADDAFAQGAREHGADAAELYLPFENFNGWKWDTFSVARKEPQPEAYAIAEKYHPAWYRLGKNGRAFHARNVHQVLGFDVTEPELTSFVLCWTKNGRKVGGTAQALRIAEDYKIPIYNLGHESTLALFGALVL